MFSGDLSLDQDKFKPLANKEFEKILGQKAKEKGHERQQKLMDSVTSVACFAIYVVPASLAILYIVVLGHKAISGEWDMLEDNLKSLLIPVTTYLAGLLSKTVLPKNTD